VPQSPDPAPLTALQLQVLAKAASRQLIWGLDAVRREHRAWLKRATAIPDHDLRRYAIAALEDKRPLLDGAALFWTIPGRRRPELLRLLVAFQVLANYHDHAGERACAGDPRPDPARTMETFVEAIDLHRPLRRYRPSSAHPDGGYLASLAATCRAGCGRLAGYGFARDHLVAAASHARSLDLEHLPDAEQRPKALRRFAEEAFGPRADLTWFELTAGSSSLLTAISVLAVAASETSTADGLAATAKAYTMVATISALLDNYVDHEDDRATGAHNYFNYLCSFDEAVERLAELERATLHEVGRLHQGSAHRVIVASMIAMYLTSDGARRNDPRHNALLVAGGGSLTAALLPVLSAWRRLRGETGA